MNRMKLYIESDEAEYCIHVSFKMTDQGIGDYEFWGQKCCQVGPWACEEYDIDSAEKITDTGIEKLEYPFDELNQFDEDILDKINREYEEDNQ